MANITTYEFFNGNISIPNSTPTKPQGELLQDFIVEYERKYLVSFFGQLQAVEIQLEIANPSISNLPYYDIINGADYVDLEGNARRWNGFAYDSNNLYSSPIANYIYFHYQQNAVTQTTGLGEVKQAVQNATMADASHKLARAWNNMVELNCDLHDYLVSIKGTYPTFDAEYSGFKYDPYIVGFVYMPNQLLFAKQNIFSL